MAHPKCAINLSTHVGCGLRPYPTYTISPIILQTSVRIQTQYQNHQPSSCILSLTSVYLAGNTCCRSEKRAPSDIAPTGCSTIKGTEGFKINPSVPFISSSPLFRPKTSDGGLRPYPTYTVLLRAYRHRPLLSFIFFPLSFFVLSCLPPASCLLYLLFPPPEFCEHLFSCLR